MKAEGSMFVLSRTETMKEERRKTRKDQGSVLVFLIISLVGLMIFVSCSGQQQSVFSTICGEGFHVLGGLDNMIEFSTDEQWILANCEATTGESKYARVFRVDGVTSWAIKFDNFPWVNQDDPLSRLFSFYWTNDGKYVYLRPDSCCSSADGHEVFVTDYSLYLLNLKTGEFSIVISGENNELSPFSVSISPDEKYLVYVDLDDKPNILNISNLETREEKAIKLDGQYSDVGAFVWTLDNSRLIFAAVFDEWKSSSLYSLEMSSLTLNTIIDNDARLLFPTSKWGYQGKWSSWKDENTLFLSEFVHPKDWAINVQSGTLEQDNSPDSPP